MGTGWTAKYLPGDSGAVAAEVKAAMSARLEELEQLFSTYRADSALSRFNANPSTDWVLVAPIMGLAAVESRQISERTGGAFDVTVHPLVQLWGFGAHSPVESVPAAADVLRIRERVGWERLEVKGDRAAWRKLRPDVTVDFSSMAKGFATDALSSVLWERGVRNHLVQVGGDMKASSRGPEGNGWPVGVERATDGGGEIAQVLALLGQALSTSGDYRNFVRRDGRRYGHIIDPRTGAPTAHALAAVSVIHGSSARASAWATALFVLGPADGFATAEREGLAALFQVRVGEILEVRPTAAWGRLRLVRE
jgi:thiamine biosynthesis lipoprotein